MSTTIRHFWYVTKTHRKFAKEYAPVVGAQRNDAPEPL